MSLNLIFRIQLSANSRPRFLRFLDLSIQQHALNDRAYVGDCLYTLLSAELWRHSVPLDRYLLLER